MSEEEKKIAEKIAANLDELSPETQQYLMGFVEGMVAMAPAKAAASENPAE